jgi:hypothetical protein
MTIDSLSLTTASESARCFKDGIPYINNTLDVNNITIKTCRSLMLEDSRIASE